MKSGLLLFALLLSPAMAEGLSCRPPEAGEAPALGPQPSRQLYFLEEAQGKTFARPKAWRQSLPFWLERLLNRRGPSRLRTEARPERVMAWTWACKYQEPRLKKLPFIPPGLCELGNCWRLEPHQACVRRYRKMPIAPFAGAQHLIHSIHFNLEDCSGP